jgi:hypothetical protein
MSAEDRHFSPLDSQEFKEQDYWENQTSLSALVPIRAIAAWSDICGFGNALRNAQWKLSNLTNGGLFQALSQTHSLLGKPFLVGVPPVPSERILVINDGVARTIDLIDPKYVDRANLIFYVRDLLMHHYMLEEILVKKGLGLRTVLAGGERCQYSSPKSTGHSLLWYNDEPSDSGKKLLEQQFVYNPAEFQMNTAFALAFTLETMGSRKGLTPNRVYIEENWLNKFNEVMPGLCEVDAQFIHFSWHGQPGLSVSFDSCLFIDLGGLSTRVYRVMSFIVHKHFEGERTEFPMNSHDITHSPT